MKALTLAVTVTLASAAYAQQPIVNESTVSGVHDVTGLITGAWGYKPQPKTRARYGCEAFEDDQYRKACMEALAGRPEEALRLLGITPITPNNDPAD